mgnify:FL=1
MPFDPGSRTILLMLAFCAIAAFGCAETKADDILKQSRCSVDRLEPCLDKAWRYSREQIKCFFIDSEEQARLARRAYEAAMRRADPVQREKLASAQSAWIKAKERKCRIYRLYNPEVAGTDEISEIYSCLGSESMDRIDWLERQYRSRRPGL